MPIFTELIKPDRNFNWLMQKYLDARGNSLVKDHLTFNPHKNTSIPKYVIYRSEYVPPTWNRHFHGSGWKAIIKEYVPWRTKKGNWNWAKFWEDHKNHPTSEIAKAAVKPYKRPGLHNRPLLAGIIEEYEDVFAAHGFTFLDENKQITVPSLVLADWFEENGCREAAELLRLTDELIGQDEITVHNALYKVK